MSLPGRLLGLLSVKESVVPLLTVGPLIALLNGVLADRAALALAPLAPLPNGELLVPRLVVTPPPLIGELFAPRLVVVSRVPSGGRESVTNRLGRNGDGWRAAF